MRGLQEGRETEFCVTMAAENLVTLPLPSVRYHPPSDNPCNALVKAAQAEDVVR
jgi:hypothetical protein